jgi:hypothetical protein
MRRRQGANRFVATYRGSIKHTLMLYLDVYRIRMRVQRYGRLQELEYHIPRG